MRWLTNYTSMPKTAQESKNVLCSSKIEIYVTAAGKKILANFLPGRSFLKNVLHFYFHFLGENSSISVAMATTTGTATATGTALTTSTVVKRQQQ